MFADFCSSLNYTHNCCKCLAVSCGNISANVRYLNSTKQFELDAVALFLSGYPYLFTLSLIFIYFVFSGYPNYWHWACLVSVMLDKQIFRGVLSLLNAKEKRPKLQCLRRFLSLSGLSKIDVFADFYGSFEPTKKPYLFLVETTIVKQCNLK